MKKLSPKDKAIHDQFSIYGKNAKEWINKCILLLPQVEKNRIWEKKRFSSIYEYAAKLAGMSRNKVNESLRILEKTENLPAIRKIIEKKGIFAVKPVVNIATIETDQLWAKKASEMSKSTLETFVRDYKAEHPKLQTTVYAVDNFFCDQAGRPGAGSPRENGLIKPIIFRNTIPKIQLSMKLDKEVISALENIKADEDWNIVMKKILSYYKKGLEAEQSELIKEKPETIYTSKRNINSAIKKFISKRSKDICEHPNCNKPGKHIHHTEPFALRKVHDPDRLVHLCKEHHQIIHLGYIDDFRCDTEPTIEWKQIEKLPSYDLKNIINQNITSYTNSYN